MALSAGTKLGPYEIVSALGAGGMGEVYKARDTRLNRTVAIKVLPAELSSNPDLKQRFEREARSISSLNHPNICTLYDVGHESGTDYLVMEHLEEETLADRLQKGALPLEQALRIAIEVADALDKAHRQGIVHRDLKPGNVMLTRSGSKLLDFGLARMWQPPAAADDVTVAGRTLEFRTRGILLGTLQYMAPELFEGKDADPRSDIFAFGCLLYEMVTGGHAFTGVSSREVISSIVRSPAGSATTIGEEMPPALRRVLEQCLAKDQEERWQCARDLCSELKWIQASLGGAALPPARRAAVWTLAALSAVLAASLLASIWWRRAPVAQSHPLVRFSIALADNESIGEYLGSSEALSSDGKRVAFVVNHGTERSIYVRSLDQLQSVPVAGTERGSGPFFSPDGEWLGFVADGKLMKVPISGGRPQALASVAFMAGASWGTDDTIVYNPIFTGGLLAVSAHGGASRRFTTPASSQGERSHLYPEILPSGREVLFTVWTGGSLDEARIAVLSLDTGKWRTVFEGGWFARYAPGYLLFMRGNTLLAAPFDWKQLHTIGPSVKVAEGVSTNLNVGAAHFDVSRTGSLAHIPGGPQPPQRSLIWVNRLGSRSVITGTRRPYTSPRLSPDGRRIALWLEGDTVNIWTYDLARDALTRLTFSPDDHNPVWSPDGKQVAFESSRSGTHHIYVQPADGTGSATQITAGDYDDYVGDWSPDGHYLVFSEWNPQTGFDLWTVGTGGQSPPKPFATTAFTEKQASFSSDGRWLAYVSDESGQNEVYVQPFLGPGAKRQVSTGGGEEPAWARSGRELFYRLGGRMMAVTVHENGEFTADRPRLLFEGLFHYTATPSRTYDVAPDGRFLMVAEPEAAYAARQINVVLNWAGQPAQSLR